MADDKAKDNGDDILPHNDTAHYDFDPWDPFEYYNVHGNWIYYSISICCAIAVFGGLFTNILAFVVLVRGRLWLQHEGYVYLAANFCVNVGILSFCTTSFWLTSVFGMRPYYPPNTSTFMCKVWRFLMSIFFASGWLCVALLFNVYLREHLIHRRRCGCPMLAAKYCTLYASKIILGVIFSVLFVFGLPYLVLFELNPQGLCYSSERLGVGLAVLFESLIMWALPFFLFLPIILLMTLCTKREGNTFGFSQIEERSTSDDQMRVVAVTLSSSTLFSHCVIIFHAEGRLSHMYPIVGTVIELVFGLSLGLQPILCFVILKALRDGFRSQLRNIRCCRRLFP